MACKLVDGMAGGPWIACTMVDKMPCGIDIPWTTEVWTQPYGDAPSEWCGRCAGKRGADHDGLRQAQTTKTPS